MHPVNFRWIWAAPDASAEVCQAAVGSHVQNGRSAPDVIALSLSDCYFPSKPNALDVQTYNRILCMHPSCSVRAEAASALRDAARRLAEAEAHINLVP
jgi:hypothetical protein